MARTVAELPAGSRITDYISLGVLAKTFPLDKVITIVAAAGKSNQRQRDLPAHVVVYYVIALTLYMHASYREVLRCLLEGVRWLLDDRSVNNYTMMVSSILYFHRNWTGSALISS